MLPKTLTGIAEVSRSHTGVCPAKFQVALLSSSAKKIELGNRAQHAQMAGMGKPEQKGK